MNIQEILNAVFDETNNLLKVTGSSWSSSTGGTVQDILNKSFDETNNSLKVTQ